MKNFHLTPAQAEELRLTHRAERNRNAAYKINAVILLGTGWKLKAVKEALLLDDETLRSYVKKYQMGGVNFLTQTNYSGKRTSLNEDQLSKLHHELDSKIYLTTGAVIQYLVQKFDIKYSSSGIKRLISTEKVMYSKNQF